MEILLYSLIGLAVTGTFYIAYCHPKYFKDHFLIPSAIVFFGLLTVLMLVIKDMEHHQEIHFRNSTEISLYLLILLAPYLANYLASRLLVINADKERSLQGAVNRYLSGKISREQLESMVRNL